MILIAAIVAVYVASVAFAPFPHWRTYLQLWKHVLTDREPAVDRAARLGQIRLLLRHLALVPLWTFLWYLDELLYPSYQRQQVRPVFIFGQPRSGSTLLHRTLARDSERFIAIRHLEWRFPYITLQKLFARFGLDQWAAKKSYWADSDEGRRAASMHPNTLYDFEEDGIFFEECFLCHYFILFRFPYVDLLSSLDDFSTLSPRDRKHILATHKKVVQKIRYLRQASDTQFYLSKEVESMTKMPEIADLYPDATFLTSARYSEEYLSSLLALIEHSTRSKTGVDTSSIARWKAVNIEKKLRDCRQQLSFLGERVPAAQQICVPYRELCRDLPGVVAHIYERLNVPLPQLNWLPPEESKRASDGQSFPYHRSAFVGFEAFDAFVAAVERAYDKERADRERIDKDRVPVGAAAR
jgi:omega-hydroxy-beta-dihydromenaquinone-9 sulfotransferase